jgi:PKD repeat protein
MPKRLLVLLIMLVGFTRPTGAATLQGPSSQSSVAPAAFVQVIEYYHAGLDHYFMTADPAEISALDSGQVSGWTRTNLTITAFSPTSSNADASAVCRFYGLPQAGLDSHFYSGSPSECEAVVLKFASSWALESSDVFRLPMPDVVTGTCAAGTQAVYRLFNNRKDANHRYTIDVKIREAMLTRGYIAEGYGPDGVAFCAPVPAAYSSATPYAAIIVSESTPGSFNFSSSASASTGASIVSYLWDFGDGATGTGATATHDYSQPGNYSVALTVSDSTGAIASAKQLVAYLSLPVATIDVLQTAPDSFDFLATISASGQATIVSEAWDFGDGSNGSGDKVSHRFAGPGTYPVVLTVADSKNAVTKAAKNVTVGTNATVSDFDARKSAPGVIRWFDFDTIAQLGSTASGANFGYTPGNSVNPVIDTTVKASGLGALRIDVPSNSPANAGGAWFGNFSADLSAQFGENSEFYVQWRQRFDQAMVDTVFQGAEGIKQAIITVGDQPGGRTFSSCQDIGNIVQTYYMARVPIIYNSCTGSASHPAFSGLYEPVGNPVTDYLLQNGTSPFCKYSKPTDGSSTHPGPGCAGWAANEWMTFQVGITLGPRNNVTREFDNSRVRFWVAREGQPSSLVLDWKPGIPGYFPLTAGPASDNQRFGKIWLLPYMTGKDASQAHPLARTWYDELIISTQRIPDPKPVATFGDNTSVSGGMVTLAGKLPAWRLNRAVGTFFEIPATANLNGAASIFDEPAYLIDVWNGLGAGPTSFWSAAASGHSIPYNATLKLELATDVPKWELVNPGSKKQDYTKFAYYADGLPTSRHTYYTTQFITSAHDRNHLDRVMLFSAFATYANDAYMQGDSTAYGGGPDVNGFRVADAQWDAGGTWSKMPLDPGAAWQIIPAVAKHPFTEDVYVAGNYQFARWNAKDGTWQLLLTYPINPAALNHTDNSRGILWNDRGSLIDAKRNRFVLLSDGAEWDASFMRLEYLDLATNVNKFIPVSGAITPANFGKESGFVHDADNDRYLVFMNRGQGVPINVYAINPDTGESTLIKEGLTPAPEWGIYNRVAYFPALGGVAYLPRFSSNVLFFPTR